MPGRTRSIAGVLGLGLAALSFAPAPPEAKEPEKEKAKGPDVVALAEARYRAALRQYEETWTYYRQARTDVQPVYSWSRFVLQAQYDLSDKRANQLAALEAHQARMKKLEALVKKVRRLGFGPSIDVGAVEYYRLEAEYWLAHERIPPPLQPPAR